MMKLNTESKIKKIRRNSERSYRWKSYAEDGTPTERNVPVLTCTSVGGLD